MCFSQSGSFGFAAVGLFAAWWIYSRTSNLGLAAGVFFLSYCAAQVPTCALVSKLGARREIRRQPLPR